MALKPCRECKKKVSTEAQTCPNCGVPNPTIKKNTKIKYIYARCGKSFCSSRYKVLKITKNLNNIQKCQTCGNTLEEVLEKDALKYIEENKVQKTQINQISETKNSNLNQKFSNKENVIARVWKGDETLSRTFWIYLVLCGSILGGLVGFFGALMQDIYNLNPAPLYILLAAYGVWSGVGLWNSSTNYKIAKLKNKQSYGWATAAKVYAVFNILVWVSQLGFIMRGDF